MAEMRSIHICAIKMHTRTRGKNLSFMHRINMLFFNLIGANLSQLF